MSTQTRLTLSSVLVMTAIVAIISILDLGYQMDAQYAATLEHAELLKGMASNAVVEALNRDRHHPSRGRLGHPLPSPSRGTEGGVPVSPSRGGGDRGSALRRPRSTPCPSATRRVPAWPRTARPSDSPDRGSK